MTLESGSHNAITIAQLSKQFANQPAPAIDHLSVKIAAGTITGLVGPDGAGKTTLLRLLCGLLRPSAGTLSVAGIDPASGSDTITSRRIRAGCGYQPRGRP